MKACYILLIILFTINFSNSAKSECKKEVLCNFFGKTKHDIEKTVERRSSERNRKLRSAAYIKKNINKGDIIYMCAKEHIFATGCFYVDWFTPPYCTLNKGTLVTKLVEKCVE